jgi:NADH-quinone oxidoreductase subunit J
MLLNLGTDVQIRTSHSVVGGVVASAIVLFQVLYLLGRGEVAGMQGNITAEVVESVGHTELIGTALFTEFLLPFEITSILLLVAIIGAVVLTKRTV